MQPSISRPFGFTWAVQTRRPRSNPKTRSSFAFSPGQPPYSASKAVGMPIARSLGPDSIGQGGGCMNRLWSPTALLAGLAGVALAFYGARKLEGISPEAFKHVS